MNACTSSAIPIATATVTTSSIRDFKPDRGGLLERRRTVI
jgi:hypothetical protein